MLGGLCKSNTWLGSLIKKLIFVFILMLGYYFFQKLKESDCDVILLPAGDMVIPTFLCP